MASRTCRALKVILLGDADAGKTSLLYKLVNSKFMSQYKATIGSDFSEKQLEIDGEHIILRIWDTAGQERFRSLGPVYYRRTDCCVLVYDVSNQKTFDDIENWVKEFRMQIGLSDSDNFPFLLVGNNPNNKEKVVQESTALEYAKNKGDMLFCEIVPDKNETLEEAFASLIKRTLKMAPKNDYEIPSSVVSLDNKQQSNENGSCC